MGDRGNTKIREQHFLMLSDQHILRLDITMDKLLFMCILQGCCHLLHKGVDLRYGYQATPGVTLSQGAVGGIIHHQKRHAILHIEIEHAHNRGMCQPGNRLCFLLEVLSLAARQVRMQHLNGCLQIQPYMLPKVDLSIATLSQQADQPVITELLSKAICHPRSPDVQYEAMNEVK